MNQMDRLKNFWESNRKVLMTVIVSVLSVFFVASIILAVFIGGEFMPDEESASVKGALKITEEGSRKRRRGQYSRTSGRLIRL